MTTPAIATYRCSACGRAYAADRPLWRCDCGSHLNLASGRGLARDEIAVGDASLWRYAAALSLRDVATGAGTSTQAIYCLFGSKEALLGALGAHAMELLHAGVDDIGVTDDPRHDLVEAALVDRRVARDHPALFEVSSFGCCWRRSEHRVPDPFGAGHLA